MVAWLYIMVMVVYRLVRFMGLGKVVLRSRSASMPLRLRTSYCVGIWSRNHRHNKYYNIDAVALTSYVTHAPLLTRT